MNKPEQQPLIAFYGDDFTGSTAVMEVLAFSGISTVLFLDLPTPELLERLNNRAAIGIAGIARSQTPFWMREHLPRIFERLASTGARFCHYKTCSTLDSAPHLGSIGAAIEIAANRFPNSWIPFFVAAPEIRRYQAFGNLFAGLEEDIHRIDRHPVMSRHPATPMDEGDVRLHLARQTDMPLGLVDLVSMKQGTSDARLQAERARGAQIITLDSADDETLAEAGRLIHDCGRDGTTTFCAGSQGVEYALCAYLRKTGALQPPAAPPRARRLEQIVAASGSVSPVTKDQINWAEAHGFAVIEVDAAKAVDMTAWNAEIERAIRAALRAGETGSSPLLVTARGPDDPAVARFLEAIRDEDATVVHGRIGNGLGRALLALVETTLLRRVAIAGGDTSGHSLSAFGIHALEALAPIAPGAPLCRAIAEGPSSAGIEVALKGGQMGGIDFFGAVRDGGILSG